MRKRWRSSRTVVEVVESQSTSGQNSPTTINNNTHPHFETSPLQKEDYSFYLYLKSVNIISDLGHVVWIDRCSRILWSVVTTKSGFGRAFQKSRESSLIFRALLASFDALRYFCSQAPAISQDQLYFNRETGFFCRRFSESVLQPRLDKI